MEITIKKLKETYVRIAGFVKESIVDGEGLRASIYMQGCPHRCEACHNPQTHEFNEGEIVSVYNLVEKIEQNPLLSGITLSGGEPFCQAQKLVPFAKYVKQKGLNIWCYSGYTLEELKTLSCVDIYVGELLELVDVLVDGHFEIELKDETLPFRGSSNQRIIDMSATRKKEMQEVVLKKIKE